VKKGEERSEEEVLDWLRSEYEQPFEGWDFSYLKGRRLEIGFDFWDYASTAAAAVRTSRVVLDQETGGGKRFKKILERCAFEGRACATEGYPPNVSVARKRLEALGVEVHEVSDPGKLPFGDETFDLLLNRHGMCTFVEEFRVLKPGGALITEQVGNGTNHEIHQLLGVPLPQSNELGNLSGARSAAEKAGFAVVNAAEAYPLTQYTDVGALVYYLKCISWQISDFSVERFSDKLLELHRKVREEGRAIDVCFHLYLLVLQKPGGDVLFARQLKP